MKTAIAAPAEEPDNRRRPSLINKAELRRRMTQYAKDKKYHFQLHGCSIKSSTISEAEAVVEAWMRKKVGDAPSKGVMI